MEVIESAKYFGNLGRFDAEKMKAHDSPKLSRNAAFYANAAGARKKFSEIPSFTRGLPAKLGYDSTEEPRGLQSKELQQNTLEHTRRTNVPNERLCRCTQEHMDHKFDDIRKSKEITGNTRIKLTEKVKTTKVTPNSVCLCPKENKA